MEDLFAKLATKRFLFITGKGGTGKSVLATALAHYFSAKKKRVLLAEMGRPRDQAFMRLHELLEIPTLHHKSTKINSSLSSSARFDASRISPTESLLEYVGMKLRSPRLTNLVLQNKITSAFLNIIPGLGDLVCLGKLWHHLEDSKANNQAYDMVILDAPASGHALQLLHAPYNFARLTKMGPIFSDASELQEFFADAHKVAVLFCSLPEEVPFEETKDFSTLARKDLPTPWIIVNKFYPLAFPGGKSFPSSDGAPLTLQPAWDYSLARIEREYQIVKRYQKQFSETACLPFFFPSVAVPYPVAAMAKYLLEGRI